MKLPYLLALFFVSLAFTSHANSVDLLDVKKFPKWFQDSYVQEAQLVDTTEIIIEQFNIKQEVLGNIKLLADKEGIWLYHINFGTKTPIECYVLTSHSGPANSMYAMMESGLDDIATLNKKKLSASFNFSLGTGVIGDTPYLQLDTLYHLGKGKKKASGILKALAAETDDGLLLCLHNSIGYRKTFYTAFESFVKAFIANKPSKAFFNPVYQYTFNDIPVGYSSEKYIVDADGDVEISNSVAMMIPSDASSISRTDSTSNSWSYADGSLINASSYSIENGELSSRFNILFEDEQWKVVGELQGKNVETSLNHKERLLSDFGNYLKVIELKSSDNNSSIDNLWNADIDPVSAVEVKFSKVAGDDSANTKYQVGPLSMKLLTDSNGVIKQASMDQAGLKLNVKLMYVKGMPQLP
ncbi:MAG: hypothetical protein ACPGJI_05015 [Kangiellaceae bacterium]